MSKDSRKHVTIVVPAYNEEQNLAGLARAIFSPPAQHDCRFDLIIVDDGSTDGTADVAKRLSGRYPITLISLARNFGKEAAMLAGLDHARGDAVIVMDADLQHPVSLFGEFLDHWRRGYDCVYAVRASRDDEPLMKRILANAFYRLLNRSSEVRVIPDALDFRLMDRRVVDALRSVRERVRFTKGLYAWVGYRSIGIPMSPDSRAVGRSRFDTPALMRLAWDGLTSFSDLPLRLATIVGAGVALASLAYAAFIVLRTLIFGIDVPGWATLTVATTFLSGLQMLFLGVIGQYVRNIYRETKHRPNYVVRELVPAPPINGAAAPSPADPVDDEQAVAGTRIAAV